MLQISLWRTELEDKHIRVSADRKNPDPDVISLKIGHDITIYMSSEIAARIIEALVSARAGDPGMLWTS